MEALKCKICGGSVLVDAASGICTCEFCGTKQSLPLFLEDSERLLYESGNNYLLHSEYDKAETVFNQLLTIKRDAPELYWDLVLCKYGVTYVKDPKTDKYVPTCNRTHYTPIFSDENYKKAIDLSSGEKKALFEEDANTIDAIQRGIISVSKKEKPFDIFISYKETNQEGNRTKDSVEAQKLYEKLTDAGYKVFFSRITLEDKVGTEYEPYIYAALHSSRVMLTVGSSKENLEAVWVKNEWSRFLSLCQKDMQRALIPLYFDMDRSDLPEEFAIFPAQNMHQEGFEQELLRGIKKLIPLPVVKKKRRGQIWKATGIAAAFLALVVCIAAGIVIPKKIEEKRLAAEEAFRASEAAALEKATEEAYQTAMTLFGSGDYTAAEAAFVTLGDYKDSAYMATRCPVQPDYDAAMQLYYDGNYAQAAWAFEALGDYEDSVAQAENAKGSWRRNLATVLSDNGYNTRYDTLYITSNGTVADCFTGTEKVLAGSHGKVVSIANGYIDIVALYEDGTLHNSKDITDPNWQDIVQIVPTHWKHGNIALKADGSVLVADLHNIYDEFGCAEYTKVLDWKNIVQLSAYSSSAGNASYESVLAGVDADGNVQLCVQPDVLMRPDERVVTFLDAYPDKFKNIKYIDVEIKQDYDRKIHYVNAAALTQDGKLISYINGTIWEQDAQNIIDVCLDYGKLVMLTSDGKVRTGQSMEATLNDVVKISEGYDKGHFSIITRRGMIHETEGCKTVVYDEWMKRLG